MAQALTFKQQNSLESRQTVSAKIREQYPDRIPVIVEKSAKARIPEIDKKKFLAPADITIAKFISEIRKHLPKLGASDSLFIFVNGNVMPQPAATMAQVYDQYRDEDGFLYILYSSENVFGG